MKENSTHMEIPALSYPLELISSETTLVHGERTPLIEAIEACKTPSWTSFRSLLKQLKVNSLSSPHHQWGDTTLGGSLGVLDMAIETGLPGLVKRCLAAGCPLKRRGHILAWRKANPLIIVILEKTYGPLSRPWKDPILEYEIAKVVAHIQFKEMDKTTALATGKREGKERL